MNKFNKDQVKNVLIYINAHRDGCIGRYIQQNFNLSKQEQIDLFREMQKEKLITFANVEDEKTTDDDLEEAIILISGGYTHPDYCGIY
jgi:hypothetical protein